MTNQRLNYVFLGTTFIVFLSCGSGNPPVGSGPPLPSGISARDLSYALLVGALQEPRTVTVVIPAIRHELIKRAFDLGLEPSSGQITVSHQGSRACFGGGSIAWKFAAVADDQNGPWSFHHESALKNCQFPITLQTKTYTVTVDGSVSGDLKGPKSGWDGITASGTDTASLTISGDLGLGAVCDLSGTNVSWHHGHTDSTTLSGGCMFYDRTGLAAQGSAEELKDLLFFALPYY